jgi:hypothetical protein
MMLGSTQETIHETSVHLCIDEPSLFDTNGSIEAPTRQEKVDNFI